MRINSTSTIEINGLTRKELGSYFEKFGQQGWLDCEGFILIDIFNRDVYELNKLDTFFNIDSRKYRFIVVNLNELH